MSFEIEIVKINMTGYRRQLFLIILCVSCNRFKARAADYEVVGDDEYFMRDCNDDEDNRRNLLMEDIFKMDLQREYGDDMETVYTSGTITVIFPARPDIPLEAEIDFLTLIRSEWIAAPFSMRRKDFCKTLSDPTEPWFPLFAKFSEEELVCPPTLGTVYIIKNSTNSFKLQNLPPFGVAGKYKIMVHFTQADNTACLVYMAHLYKK